ncbi:MAG: hypothetical protein WCZ11_00700 [Bacilli bacterium]
MNVPLYGDSSRKLFSHLTTLAPSAQDSPNMTIKVAAGGFWIQSSGTWSYVEYVGGNSPTLTAPSANAKWVVVAFNPSGALVALNGSEASSPVLPTIPKDRYPIAFVYLIAGVTAITNSMVFDARPLFCNPIRSHADLADNTGTDSHPIAAITGLTAALAAKVESTALTTLLADKADQDGSNAVTFTLNKDATGTPSADVYFYVERDDSTNVAIRWNESTEKWEYTDNGSDWIVLSSFYVNDGTQEFVLKLVEATTEPTITTTGATVLWKDTDDSNRIYLVFKRGVGDQVKVELV